MSKSRVTILALAILLVASNAWWAYHVLNAGVTATYREASFQENHEALAQALATLPAAARPGATRAQILEAARQAASSHDTFEKDGFTWVGRLGFKFNAAGGLVEVQPAWSPF